jgi:hypothetical protein
MKIKSDIKNDHEDRINYIHSEIKTNIRYLSNNTVGTLIDGLI